MKFKREILEFLFKCSKKIPAWLYKFNSGVIFYTKEPKIITRENKNYKYETASYGDLDALSKISGFSVEQLKNRFDAGDTCIISRELATGKIKTVLWAHFNHAYVRGFNLQLNLPENSAYFYWGYSTLDVRMTGIFNGALLTLINMLKEKQINNFYALVEFWNDHAMKYHRNQNYEDYEVVTYLKILCFKFTIHKYVRTKKIKIEYNIKRNKNPDII